MKTIIKASEVSIQATCRAWLQLDQWRLIQTDMKQLRGLGVQEKGMADDLFLRYIPRYEQYGPCTNVSRLNPALTEVIWIEWKSKRGQHGELQKEWQRAERARGALVWVAKQDFDPTIEGFQEHYRKSGLCRRMK